MCASSKWNATVKVALDSHPVGVTRVAIQFIHSVAMYLAAAIVALFNAVLLSTVKYANNAHIAL